MYDGLYTLFLRIANMAVAAGLGILTARVLGPAGKGVYAMPMVLAGLVATAFGGLSLATSFFLLNRSAGRRIVTPMLAGSSVLIFVAAVAVVAIASVGHTLWAVPAALASLPASAATSLVVGYVTGIKRIRYASSLTFATTVVTLMLMSAGLFLVARNAWVAIAVWIVATTLVSFVALLAVILHARTLQTGERVPFGAYLGMALKMGAGGLVSFLNYRADLYIVAVFLPAAALGLYTVAVSAAESLLIPTQAAALVASPHIGGVERTVAARITARCVRNNLLIAVSLCGVIFVCSPYIVRLLYGEAFVPLVPALRVLLVGLVSLSLGSPISSYYTLKLGKPEIPLVMASASAALCIVVAVALVPHLGIVGAAIASTIAYLFGQGLGVGLFSVQARVPLRTILIPTLEDIRTYVEFGKRVYRDGWTMVSLRLNPTSK
jgi:O-antigen/teichoic acid export membrane protein